MRKRLIGALVVCSLALGAVAASASAAPANHSEFEGCTVLGEYEFCSLWRGLGKVTTTPSGQMIFMQHSELTATITHLPTGGVEVRSSKGNSGVIYKDGVFFLTHGVSRESTTRDGVTCDVKYAVVVVNGELRHFVYDVTCN